ncbi:hypothetical protein RAA17_00235 [Komagataeibacter rhaeticus]|nr:hypothetical protein [Komagataeibacter rhaeticus]
MIWRHRRIDRVTRTENGQTVAVDYAHVDQTGLPPVDHLVACTSCGLVGNWRIRFPACTAWASARAASTGCGAACRSRLRAPPPS